MTRQTVRRTIGTLALGGFLALIAAVVPGPAIADVFLNELKIQGTERVELFNSGAGAVDVNGYTLQGEGIYVIAGADSIASGGYLVIEPPIDIFGDSTGFIELLDGGNQLDGVAYGQTGSAPLPPLDTLLRLPGPLFPSLARAPDGSSFSTPPPNSPATDGTFWTIDLTSTFGSMNDVLPSALGTSLFINEIDPKPSPGGDVVELYNPFAASISLSGWWLTNGVVIQALAGSVPGTGFLTVVTDPGFEFDDTEVIYLFDATVVRVDQLGVHLPPVRGSAPPLDPCQCYARFADGAGPILGYDWPTSGGNATLWTLLCSFGATNLFIRDCPTSVDETWTDDSWGRIKAVYR